VLWVTYIVKEVKHPPLHFSFTSSTEALGLSWLYRTYKPVLVKVNCRGESESLPSP
jgi:hypothetical protein